MAVDAETTDLERTEAERERLGVFALFVAVIRRPSAAMARIAERPKGRWIVPLVLLAVLSTVSALIYAPRMMEQSLEASQAAMAEMGDSADPEQVEVMASAQQMGRTVGIVAAGIGGAIGTFITALIAAAVLHFLATVMGGQQAFMEVFSTTAWARVPLILRSVFHIPWLLAGGFDPNPSGLAGLVTVGETPGASSYLVPLLSQIEVWNLWYLALLVVAIMASAKLTRGRAITVVGIFVLAQLALGMAGVAMGIAFAQLFS